MAVKDGLPATDFSRMNREYIKAVAEGGSGGGGVLVCTVTPIPGDPNNNVILDKTWAEIYAAASSGVPVFVFEDASASPDIMILFDLVTSVEKNSDTEYIVLTGLGSTEYAAATEDGYPKTENS